MNSEVIAGQLEREPGRVADRRAVAGTVPGRFYAEEFAECGHFARHRKPADLRDVNPDKINQPLGDQGNDILAAC